MQNHDPFDLVTRKKEYFAGFNLEEFIPQVADIGAPLAKNPKLLALLASYGTMIISSKPYDHDSLGEFRSFADEVQMRYMGSIYFDECAHVYQDFADEPRGSVAHLFLPAIPELADLENIAVARRSSEQVPFVKLLSLKLLNQLRLPSAVTALQSPAWADVTASTAPVAPAASVGSGAPAAAVGSGVPAAPVGSGVPVTPVGTGAPAASSASVGTGASAASVGSGTSATSAVAATHVEPGATTAPVNLSLAAARASASSAGAQVGCLLSTDDDERGAAHAAMQHAAVCAADPTSAACARVGATNVPAAAGMGANGYTADMPEPQAALAAYGKLIDTAFAHALPQTTLDTIYQLNQEFYLACKDMWKFNGAVLCDIPDCASAPGVYLSDMDSTAIGEECLDEIAKQVPGCGEKVAQITAAAMRGEMDFPTSLRTRLGLVKGVTVDQLYEILRNIKITRGYPELTSFLQDYDWKCGLISSGFTFFTHAIAQKCNLDFDIGNQLEIVSDKLTGNVVGPILDGQFKKEFLAQCIQKYQVAPTQSIATGDGSNDRFMLKDSGFGVAYFGKKLLTEKFCKSFIVAPNSDMYAIVIMLKVRLVLNYLCAKLAVELA